MLIFSIALNLWLRNFLNRQIQVYILMGIVNIPKVKSFFEAQGIQHFLIPPHTLQHNGTLE